MDSTSDANARQQQLDRDIERYRAASDAALDQLEWVVAYLNKIHKPQIARALDRNRKQILQTRPARNN